MGPIGFGHSGAARLQTIVLALLAVAVVAAFFPLTRYFLAQDDFVLVERATWDWSGAVGSSFSPAPGHVRPLTKGLYFAFAARAFGLHATAYHWVSIILHLVNVLLVYLFLCRLRAPLVAALAATILFGLNVGNFHVIAWAACVQQLMGTAFVLLTLITGADAIAGRRSVWPSLIAHLAALMCFEQALGTSIVLALTVPLLDTRDGRRRTLAAHALVTIAYVAFVLAWKRLPDDGPYAIHMGVNVLANLAVYAGWAFAPFALLPDAMNATRPSPSPSHVVMVAVAVYLLARGRARWVWLGWGAFAAMLLPALPLRNHTYFLHNYPASIGVAVLVGGLVADALGARALRSRERRHAALGTWLAVAAVLAFAFVRANERLQMYGDTGFRRSFVLRRAEIARNAYNTVRRSLTPGAQRVVMVYGRGTASAGRWNRNNVIEALGNGSALRLFYGREDLQVEFVDTIADIPGIDAGESDLFIYDDRGNCRPIPTESVSPANKEES